MTIDERAKGAARLILFGNGLLSSAIEVAKQALTAAIEEEREECAKIAESIGCHGGTSAAALIRNRRNKSDGETK